MRCEIWCCHSFPKKCTDFLFPVYLSFSSFLLWLLFAYMSLFCCLYCLFCPIKERKSLSHLCANVFLQQGSTVTTSALKLFGGPTALWPARARTEAHAPLRTAPACVLRATAAPPVKEVRLSFWESVSLFLFFFFFLSFAHRHISLSPSQATHWHLKSLALTLIGPTQHYKFSKSKSICNF